MRLYDYLLVVCVILMPFILGAQSKKAMALYEKGLAYEKERAYPKAKEYYLKALEKEPDYFDPIFQLGAIAYDSEQLEDAYLYLGKALEKKPALLAKIGYQLGRAALETDRLEEAGAIFKKYLALKNVSPSLRSKAEMLAEKSDFILNNKIDFDFNPINMGPAINSKNPENGPSLTADGQTIVFTRETGYQEDLWMAHKKDSSWQPAFLVPNVNTEQQNEGAQCISPDGSIIVFVACDRKGGYGGCDLYWSERVNNGWSKPKNIDFPVNDRGRETQPTIGPDNRTIIFASDRPGGFGKLDLYSTYLKDDGSWEKPVNLGPNINTPEDDRTPFLHPDGKTLYFSSRGHTGFGGFDLFRGQLIDDGTWGTPQNLGSPLNTDGHEGSLTVSLDGKTGYYTSDKGETLGKTDIFSFELPEKLRPDPVTFVRASVIDAETKKRLEAEVLVENLSTKQNIAKMATKEGSFLVCLPVGKSYGMQVSKKGYAFTSKHFDLLSENSTYPVEIVLELTPIRQTVTSEPSKPIVLENIFFESGSAKLSEISFSELDQLVSLLKDNPARKIAIHGHTDNVGDTAANQTLSEDRAQAVVNYLLQHGIASDRLSAEGFGESRPIATNDNEVGRRQNRRTEFVLF